MRDSVVGVRSTHDPDKSTVLFNHEEWRNFIIAAKAGHFDLPARPVWSGAYLLLKTPAIDGVFFMMKKWKPKNWDEFFASGLHCAPVKAWEKKLLTSLPKSSAILDLGCGEGVFGLAAVRAGHKYFGFD